MQISALAFCGDGASVAEAFTVAQEIGVSGIDYLQNEKLERCGGLCSDVAD
jgi:hypothetical protein